MTTGLDELYRSLKRLDAFRDLPREALEPFATKGVSHDHVRIRGRGLVVRVPRFSQWKMPPPRMLAYETAAFARAAASGHVPALIDVIPAGDPVPTGALIVQEVPGRPPAGPEDFHAMAGALAALHTLAVPRPAARPPLLSHDRPVAATLAVIEEQASYLTGARLEPAARSALEAELDWARGLAGTPEDHGFRLALVGTDTHPGNFLIDDAGKAWFVDLEKAVYGAAPIDLAHATLAVSVGWDPDAPAAPSRELVRAFYRHYLDLVDADARAAFAPWLMPMRRLTWLRTMTWLARWRADWAETQPVVQRNPALLAHAERHIAASFGPDAIAAARSQWLGPDPLELV
ncbi:MAG: aminoglycoside phosphotransferase [Alphaproteobacteria bacterium]